MNSNNSFTHSDFSNCTALEMTYTHMYVHNWQWQRQPEYITKKSVFNIEQFNHTMQTSVLVYQYCWLMDVQHKYQLSLEYLACIEDIRPTVFVTNNSGSLSITMTNHRSPFVPTIIDHHSQLVIINHSSHQWLHRLLICQLFVGCHVGHPHLFAIRRLPIGHTCLKENGVLVPRPNALRLLVILALSPPNLTKVRFLPSKI